MKKRIHRHRGHDLAAGPADWSGLHCARAAVLQPRAATQLTQLSAAGTSRGSTAISLGHMMTTLTQRVKFPE